MSTGSAEMIDRQVAGDLKKPGMERRGFDAIGRNGLHHLQEHVCGQVFGCLQVAAAIKEVSVNALVITPVQSASSFRAAFHGLSDQIAWNGIVRSASTDHRFSWEEDICLHLSY